MINVLLYLVITSEKIMDIFIRFEKNIFKVTKKNFEHI